MDFGFVFCRVMKFYGMGYEEIMALPIKTFWLMSDCINRVSAASEMRQLSIYAAAQSGEKQVEAAMQRLSSEIGVVSVEKPVRDAEGVKQLQLM